MTDIPQQFFTLGPNKIQHQVHNCSYTCITPELIQKSIHLYWYQSNYNAVQLEYDLKIDRILASKLSKAASFSIKKNPKTGAKVKVRESCIDLRGRTTTRNKNMLYINFFLDSLTSVISRLFTFSAVFVSRGCLKGALLLKVGDGRRRETN